MEIEKIKCSVCPTVNNLKKNLLDSIWDNKAGFTNEDDADLACSIIEKVFDKLERSDK